LKVFIKRTFYILFSLIILIFALLLLTLQPSPHVKAVHQFDANFATNNKNKSALLVQARLAQTNNESAIIPILATLPERIT